MRQTTLIADTPLDSPRAFSYVPALPAPAHCRSRENLSETARPLRGLMDLMVRARETGDTEALERSGASLVPAFPGQASLGPSPRDGQPGPARSKRVWPISSGLPEELERVSGPD